MERIRNAALRCALTATAALVLAGFTSSAAGAMGTVIYSNLPETKPGNVVSQAFEATQLGQFGGQIEFAKAAGSKPQVTVALSSWGCQEGSGTSCKTEKGAKFEWPITLHIYNVGALNALGSEITSVTQTFMIPYRPSASPKCTGAKAGKWFYKGTCFSGKYATIKFKLKGVSLPSKVIVSVSYNTSDYGAEPQRPKACNSTTAGCPYDSLNVGLTEPLNAEEPAPVAPSVGSDPAPEVAYQDSTTAANYCDAGIGGTGVFRLDSGVPPCWTGYQPLLQVSSN
ncbi:MAG TPA: hypothetical protein VGD00_07935 [Solirubrobacteraceae bacterium]|jgi:hypothetical protein